MQSEVKNSCKKIIQDRQFLSLESITKGSVSKQRIGRFQSSLLPARPA
jgi:hypothetical protein